jgi:hypothetical protein
MESAVLSMEQSRRTTAAVCACITDQDYATGLIALAILAELAESRSDDLQFPVHPLLQSVRVTAEGLYRHRAVREEFTASDRKSEHLQPFMDALRTLPFEVVACADGNGDPAAPAPRPRHGDILLDIVRVKEWSNPGDWRSPRSSWLVRGGQWAYWNMNETGRVLLCRIAAASLSQPDPVSVVLTMKLGRALGFGAAYPAKGGMLELSVGEALDTVGELPISARSDGDWAQAACDGFVRVLASLEDTGVVSKVSWPSGSPPFFGGNREKDPRAWLDAQFRFAPARIPLPPVGWRKSPRLEVIES